MSLSKSAYIKALEMSICVILSPKNTDTANNVLNIFTLATAANVSL